MVVGIVCLAVGAFIAGIVIGRRLGRTSNTESSHRTPALDHVRLQIPGVAIRSGEREILLSELPREKAVLLFSLSSFCEPCKDVAKQLSLYQRRLPEVEFAVLIDGDSKLIGIPEYLPVYCDETSLTAYQLQMPGPSALLLGVDGMTVGEVALGKAEIELLLDTARRHLDGSPNPIASAFYPS